MSQTGASAPRLQTGVSALRLQTGVSALRLQTGVSAPHVERSPLRSDLLIATTNRESHPRFSPCAPRSDAAAPARSARARPDRAARAAPVRREARGVATDQSPAPGRGARPGV